MSDLRTDYADDILTGAMEGKRRYNIVASDGTIVASNVYLQDMTSYEQVGDDYGADDINATNEAVNQINSALNKGSVYVTADGVKNHTTLLNELFGLIDSTKIRYSSILSMGKNQYYIDIINNSEYTFTRNYAIINLGEITGGITCAHVKASNSLEYGVSIRATGITTTQIDTYIPPSGTKYTIHY